MSVTKIQNNQTVNEAALPVTRQAARTEQKDINAAFDQNNGNPLRLYASNPSDALLNIAPQEIQLADGIGKSAPPNSSTIPTVVASTLNFQTGATTGATFSGFTLPTSTIGYFRRVGFTLLASGTIQVIFTAEASSLGAVANPGTVFVKGSIPIGWVDIVATAATAFKTAGSATSIIENSVSGTSTIHVFGSGGSGSGSGDANAFLETLKNRLIESSYTLLTPYIPSVDGESLKDGSSTATYSLVDGTINFTGVQNFISTQLADSNEFLANTDALSQVELMVEWLSGSVDTGATYQVARNGLSGTYQNISMSRVGTTNLYRGQLTLADEGTNQTLSNQTTVTASNDLNATTQQRLSQPFTIASGTKYLAKTVTVELAKTGSPTGYFYVQLVNDNAGNPSTAASDVLCESFAQSISSLSAGNNSVVVDIPDTYLAAGTYHIVIRTDSAYTAGYAGGTKIAWRGNASGSTPYARQYDGTSWSVFSTNTMGYTLTGISIDIRIKIISSMTSKLAGIGLFYNAQTSGLSPSSVKQREVVSFSGSSNLNTFTLTKFLPDPDALKVYDVNTGQVYTYGAFSLNGYVVTFAAGQFNSPGQTLTLVFDQTIAGSFDNSDQNAALMAANHLGSTSATLDRSIAGLGLYLRSPNGTLFEITVADDGSIATYAV